MKWTKQLVFWGQADHALLLTKALKQAGLDPIDGLEVPIRYEVDCRKFCSPDGSPYLGLVIDVGTAKRDRHSGRRIDTQRHVAGWLLRVQKKAA